MSRKTRRNHRLKSMAARSAASAVNSTLYEGEIRIVLEGCMATVLRDTAVPLNGSFCSVVS